MKYYRHIKHCLFFLALMFLINTGCEEELSQAVKLYNGGDITAPTLTDIKADTATKFIMEFDEHLSDKKSSVEIDNNMSVKSVNIRENLLTFELEQPSDPGKEYTMSATVRDAVGNTALIVEKIYGFNPNIPKLLIHEFTTEGSKSKPDKVEMLVLSSGNTAGITLQEGGIRSYKQRVLFPAMQVQKDDFIVVHFRAPPNAVSERKSKAESQLKIAYKSAWDIFHTHEKLTGIGNSNGALTLLENPHGRPMDVVLYSNKKDDKTKKDRGFASKEVYSWVQEIEQAGMWKPKNGTELFPSDALNPTDSTTTRSINRKQHKDTNSADDWYIVHTGKSTFGKVNSQQVYVPKKGKTKKAPQP